MKVAVIGSRGLDTDIPEKCIPKKTTQLISGGAKGIDTKVREFAIEHGIQILEILPDYDLFGKNAPLIRNDTIIKLSDLVVALWDGKSRGTQYVISKCIDLNKKLIVYILNGNEYEEHFSNVDIL